MPTLDELRPIADLLGIAHTTKTTKTDLAPRIEAEVGRLEDEADAAGLELITDLELGQVQTLLAAVNAAGLDTTAPAPDPVDEYASDVGDHVDQIDPRDPATQPAPPPAPRRTVTGSGPVDYVLAAWFVRAALGPAPDYAGQTVTRDAAAAALAAGYTPTGDPVLDVVEETTDRIRLRASIEVAA